MIDGKRRLVLFIVNGRYHPGEDRQLDENVMVFRVVTPLARAMHNCNLKVVSMTVCPSSIVTVTRTFVTMASKSDSPRPRYYVLMTSLRCASEYLWNPILGPINKI